MGRLGGAGEGGGGVMQQLQTVAEQIIGILILQVRPNEIYKLGYCSLTDIREMSQGYSQMRFLSIFFFLFGYKDWLNKT